MQLNRTKGSSLIEVVVGLFIISLSIALTGVLFGQVFDSSKRILVQKAWYDMNLMRNQILLTKDIEPEDIGKKAYRIVKSTVLKDENKGLWLISLCAYEHNGEDQTIEPKELIATKFYLEINPLGKNKDNQNLDDE